jgi:SAM-dependent methyltransferase
MRKEDYKIGAHQYWNEEYQKNGWKVVHDAGGLEKTNMLAIREIDLFLWPTKEKCEALLNDKENNPWPTFNSNFYTHPSIDELRIERKTCLDYGCGALGRYSFALSNVFDAVYGVDISSEAIADAKNRVNKHFKNSPKFLLCDGVSLKFPSNFFDFVFSNLVLQHIGNKDVILALCKEFARCLKPGGAARLEFLDGTQDKGDKFYSVVEGNGMKVEEIKSVFEESGCKLIHATEGHPYLWVTIQK